jgi:hypothetical protein
LGRSDTTPSQWILEAKIPGLPRQQSPGRTQKHNLPFCHWSAVKKYGATCLSNSNRAKLRLSRFKYHTYPAGLLDFIDGIRQRGALFAFTAAGP